MEFLPTEAHGRGPLSPGRFFIEGYFLEPGGGQGKVSTRSWVCLGAFSVGFPGGSGDRGGEAAPFNVRAGLVSRFWGSSGHTGCSRPLCLPSIQTIEYCYLGWISEAEKIAEIKSIYAIM